MYLIHIGNRNGHVGSDQLNGRISHIGIECFPIRYLTIHNTWFPWWTISIPSLNWCDTILEMENCIMLSEREYIGELLNGQHFGGTLLSFIRFKFFFALALDDENLGCNHFTDDTAKLKIVNCKTSRELAKLLFTYMGDTAILAITDFACANIRDGWLTSFSFGTYIVSNNVNYSKKCLTDAANEIFHSDNSNIGLRQLLSWCMAKCEMSNYDPHQPLECFLPKCDIENIEFLIDCLCDDIRSKNLNFNCCKIKPQ